MGLTKKDFEDFKGYFTQYRKEFGLTGYKIIFHFKDLKDTEDAHVSAQILADTRSMVAEVTLNKSISRSDLKSESLSNIAQHEALHLLLDRFDNAASSRFLNPSELHQVNEELVNKIQNLISRSL